MTADPVPLFGPEMREDPYPFYRRLREADPVYWSEKFQAWIVTAFDEVVAGLNDLRLSSDRIALFRQLAHSPDLEPLFSFLSKRMVLTDPPRHTRLRALVSKTFTPHVVEGMRPHVQQLVDGFLDAVQPAGRMDVMADLAFPLPSTVICELLGLPPEDRGRLKTWSDALIVYFSTHPAEITNEQWQLALRGMHDINDYTRTALARIRAEGRPGLLPLLADAEIDGDRLSEEELFANVNLLLVAGHETTMCLIGNGVYELLKHPDQLALVKADPARIPGAVEEFLRFDCPVQFTHRIALEDLTLGGKTIRKGQFVFLFLAAANRDPKHFPDPDTLDITRPPGKHLTFGQGHHFCPGAPLARLEAQIAFTTMLRRLPNLTLAIDRVTYRDNFNLRGPQALPVTFG